MSRRALQSRKQVCQLCDFITTKQSTIRPTLPISKSTHSSRPFTTSRTTYLQNTQPLAAQPIQKSKSKPSITAPKKHEEAQVLSTHATEEELTRALEQARAGCKFILELERIPTESETLDALFRCESLAKAILDYESPPPDPKRDAVSALLQLDQSTKQTPLPRKIPPPLYSMIDELSDLAYAIIKHPSVFIAPKALEVYVSTQASLRRPQTLPEAFHLYAHKPLPKAGTSSPIKYKTQNPNKVGNAIPIPIADQALQAAIDAKQLTTAMDLIETSYATTAFKRAKFVRRGLIPATGLAVAPVAAYTVASQLAVMQTTMDTQMATTVAFTGLLAYMGFTGTIGIVALTTANDQMERVSWAQGMPLRERWMREEERAAIDRIAQSWGFKEVWRRGEEEGVDWDALRDWAGERGMLVDAAELMEGME